MEGDPRAAAIAVSWFEDHFDRIEFFVIEEPDGRWLIRFSPVEQPGSKSLSYHLDSWLWREGGFHQIRWYTAKEWTGSKQWQEQPW
jgi:hypothetical protein